MSSDTSTAWITPDTAPAWAQAVLIVLTILFTYWLARLQDHRAERQQESERRHRAQALATALLPALMILKFPIEKRKGWIRGLSISTPAFVRRPGVLQIEIPAMLRDSWQTHYQFGKASRDLLQMLARIQLYNDDMAVFSAALEILNTDERYPNSTDGVIGWLDDIEDLRAKAVAQISEIYEGHFKSSWY